jgi:hypothetical protein
MPSHAAAHCKLDLALRCRRPTRRHGLERVVLVERKTGESGGLNDGHAEVNGGDEQKRQSLIAFPWSRVETLKIV